MCAINRDMQVSKHCVLYGRPRRLLIYHQICRCRIPTVEEYFPIGHSAATAKQTLGRISIVDCFLRHGSGKSSKRGEGRSKAKDERGVLESFKVRLWHGAIGKGQYAQLWGHDWERRSRSMRRLTMPTAHSQNFSNCLWVLI